MDLINLLGSEWGSLRYLIGFLALPLVFLRDCIDIWKDTSVAARTAGPGWTPTQVQDIQASLYVFTLDALRLVPASVLVFGLFGLAELVPFSSRIASNGAVEGAQGVVNLFAFGVGLGAICHIRWSKVRVYRLLQEADFANLKKSANATS